MACRDLTRAARAADEIRQTTGNSNIVVRHLDLASMYSVRELAKEFTASEDRLDILINNAGEHQQPLEQPCLDGKLALWLQQPLEQPCLGPDSQNISEGKVLI